MDTDNRHPNDGLTSRQAEEVERIAERVAIIKVDQRWAEMGVNAGTFEGRQLHFELLQWTRQRKAKIEAGWSRIGPPVVAAVAAALVTAVMTFFFGKHP